MPRSTKTDTLLDGIKDGIDKLGQIKSPAKRKAAAKEIIAYIELHHDLPSTQP